MTKMTTKITAYRCNLCGDEQKPSDLRGFKVSGCGGLSVILEAYDTDNHLCIRCFTQIGQIYNKKSK